MSAPSDDLPSRQTGVPAVSVVIPTCGRPQLVRRAVRSALAQTLADIEVIVVVDGPDARTCAELAKIADDRLRVLPLEQRRGNGGARNAGVDVARAERIAFLDDDDAWETDKLARQVDLEATLDARFPIISCRFEAKGNGARFVWPRKLPEIGQPISEYLFTRRGPTVRGAIQTSTMVVPKALFDKVRFDEDLDRYVDLDWLLRAAQIEGVSLHYVGGEPLSTYAIDDSRKRISNQAGWRRDLEWIEERRDLVTPRAYAGYCLTQASIRAEKSRDKRAFLPLLYQAIRHGKFSSGELIFHTGNTLLPAWLRRRLTNRPAPKFAGQTVQAQTSGADRQQLTPHGERRLRVLVYSAAHKADAAGVQGVVIGLADYLRRQGHEVATAWPDGDDTRDDWRLHLEAGVGRTGRPTPLNMARAALDMAMLTGKLARLRPDVVNLHYPRGQTLYFFALRRVFGYRIVLSFHNSDLYEASEALRPRFPGWLRRADGVTAVSDELAQQLGQLAPTVPAQMIANGVDTDFWSPGPAKDREADLLVAAGRLIPFKGFDVLLEALARAPASKGRLALAGEGTLEGDLRRRIAELGLQDRVELVGRLDRHGLRALFRRGSMFVMPSHREGMPLVLLEAMASGLPIVATPVGGIPTVMSEEAGELVQPDDPAILADAIGRRLTDGDLRARESAGARAQALRFAADKSFARYERTFLDLVQ